MKKLAIARKPMIAICSKQGGRTGGCHGRRAWLALQPLRELLLQICCRCSHRQQSIQFMIADWGMGSAVSVTETRREIGRCSVLWRLAKARLSALGASASTGQVDRGLGPAPRVLFRGYRVSHGLFRPPCVDRTVLCNPFILGPYKLTVFGFSLFGDALRDALDPKLRDR